ncbi:response regulator receiver protein, partial [Kocuria rosea]|nr:response regulator receiver protein [Kocuria rosea]
LGCCPGPVLRAAHQRVLEATAATGDELAQAVAALLVLHGHHQGLLPASQALPGAPDPRARREAAGVLRAFLGRTLTPTT